MKKANLINLLIILFFCNPALHQMISLQTNLPKVLLHHRHQPPRYQ
jgi:hypothetical protein